MSQIVQNEQKIKQYHHDVEARGDISGSPYNLLMTATVITKYSSVGILWIYKIKNRKLQSQFVCVILSNIRKKLQHPSNADLLNAKASNPLSAFSVTLFVTRRRRKKSTEVTFVHASVCLNVTLLVSAQTLLCPQLLLHISQFYFIFSICIHSNGMKNYDSKCFCSSRF